MGRRFNTLIGTALAVIGIGLATRTVAARQDGASPAPTDPAATSAPERPVVLPPTPDEAKAKASAKTKDKDKSKSKGSPKAQIGTATPTVSPVPDFAATPSNLGPEPTPYSLSEAEADVPAKPAADGPALKMPFPIRFKADTKPTPKPAAKAEGDAEAAAGFPAPVVSLPPAPALPAPAEIAAPAPSDPLDAAVERAQATGTPPAAGTHPAPTPTPTPTPAPTPVDAGPLPPASVPPGQAAAAPPANSTPPESFVLPPDRLQLGRQSIGLTVDVVAPQVLNINQAANLKIVVKNNGQNDALGVVVRDELPPTLTFVSCQPEPNNRIDALLTWNLGTIQAGSERVITVSVKPTAVGAFDHSATVTMMAGGKSRTVVREPKLRVEQSVSSAKILRGQPVQFKIAVSNPGDGPARNVLVQAKLSPGLRHESGEPNDQNLFEQTIDLIGPGETVSLETLVADTTLGGEQSCQIAVKSPDVVAGAPEAINTQTITVVEPKLTMTVDGPKNRYTDTLATYDVTLENPGSAAARNVRVLATLPVSGRLCALPAGARFDPQTRKLTWVRPQLDPSEKAVLSFQIRMGGIGQYQVAAEVRADGALLAKNHVVTDVEGLADVTFDVTEKKRVVDVDGKTVYLIKVVNSGSKTATGLQVSADLSKNIQPGPTSGTDKVANWDKSANRVVFPPIARLGPGKSIELVIQVTAVEPGIAMCHVSLTHDDLPPPSKLEHVAAFRVMPTRR
jgi:uncharacterized repeat protein (TIGR01451 family)